MPTETDSTREKADPAFRRNWALPLSLQILGWFFLNVLVAACVVAALFHAQSAPILNALIAGDGGDRLEAIASELGERLAQLPRSRWPELMTSVSKRYHASFALMRRDGDPLAGAIPQPSDAVIAKIREFAGPRPPRPPSAPDREDPSPSPQPFHQGGPPALQPAATETLGAAQPGHPQDQPALSNFRFLLHEGGLYWAGVRLPPDHARGRGPTTLLMVSSSLLSGGLLLDTTPLWIAAALLLGSALFWVPLVRRITIPLGKMRNAARRMAQGQFDTRVSIQRGDEIGGLASSLNHLGERLEEFVTGQKRFLGDIAHELGSPLARMQFAIEIVAQNATPGMAPLLEDVREEVGQMTELLGEILQFTKAGLHTDLHLEAVEVRELVLRAMEQENITATPLELQVSESLKVQADRRYMLRAVANVLRNAVRHAGAASPLKVQARETRSAVLLSVSDEGPGVPEAFVHRLGDPFFRTESARTRETGGVGLGLAIVKRCVEACGGTVSIRNLKPHGLCVEMQLSRADASPTLPEET
jgi:two-component system, OmpR family, sensor histidine kinase CpxA